MPSTRITKACTNEREAWDAIKAVETLGLEVSALWACGRWYRDDDDTEIFGPFEVTLLKRPGGSYPVLFEDTVAKKTVRVSPAGNGWLDLSYYAEGA